MRSSEQIVHFAKGAVAFATEVVVVVVVVGVDGFYDSAAILARDAIHI